MVVLKTATPVSTVPTVLPYRIDTVMNANARSIMCYQDDINTEHNMNSISRAAVAQWTKRLTRNGYTRVQNCKGANILLLHWRRG